MKRAPLLLFVVLLLVAGTFIAMTTGALPARVATHAGDLANRSP
ncbi:MAG: hypothetical protein ABI724_10690 [Betaproteobacteria bacterium]